MHFHNLLSLPLNFTSNSAHFHLPTYLRGRAASLLTRGQLFFLSFPEFLLFLCFAPEYLHFLYLPNIFLLVISSLASYRGSQSFGPQTSSIIITQELVGNASFWAPPQTYWFRKSLWGGGVSAIWILISLPGDADALKFENHCLTNIQVSAILKKNAFPYLGQVMTLVFLLPPFSAKHLERIVHNLSLFLLLSTHWLMSSLVLLPRSSVTSYCLIRSSFSIFL